MMADELDFEDDNLMSSDLKIEVDYSAPNVKEECIIGEESKTTGEVKSDSGGVTGDAGKITGVVEEITQNIEQKTGDTGELSGDIGVITCDTGELSSGIGRITGDIGEITGDTEGITGDTEGITGDTEGITGDRGEINCEIENIICDSEEISCDVGVDSDPGMESDTEKVASNKGNANNDVKEVDTDIGRMKNDTESVEAVSDTGEVDSDTGEIHSDTGEIPNNDLEEGELDEGIPVPLQTKTSEAICRFFKRGACMFGSQCRFPHSSPMGYNMFEPVLSNKSNFKYFGSQNVQRPVFQPNHLPMEPYIESSWEIGIKKAKIIMQKGNLKNWSEPLDDLDIENDWERCLAEAQANIQKSSFKRKSVDIEKPYFNSKYSKQENFRERSPVKRDYDIKESFKHYRKPKPLDVRPVLDHLKFVDPWRRSRSPRKRIRTMSFSLSPSPPLRRSRSRSISSSSSSCFEKIYASSHKVNATGKKSRSRSASPYSKKDKTFRAQTYNRKRSYSKSFSKSPRKRIYSGSSSSESSGKCQARKKPYNKDLKPFPSRVAENKDDKLYAPIDRPKNAYFPPATKSLFKKTRRRTTSTSHSDSSSGDSYLSETSVSSLSDVDVLKTTYSKGKPFKKRESLEKEKEVRPLVRRDPYEKEKGRPFMRREPYEKEKERPFVRREPYEKEKERPFVRREPYEKEKERPFVRREPYEKEKERPFVRREPYEKEKERPFVRRDPYEKEKERPFIRREPQEKEKERPFVRRESQQKETEGKPVVRREPQEKEKEGGPFERRVSQEREKKAKPYTKREPQEKEKEETLKVNNKNLETNQSVYGGFCKLSEDFDSHLKQKKPAHDTSRFLKTTEASTKSTTPHSDKIIGSQSTTSHLVSKPNITKKLPDQKPSAAAAMELLKYHSFGQVDDKTGPNPSSVVIQPSQSKSTSSPLEAIKSKHNVYFKDPITKKVAPKNTPDVQSKSPPMNAANVKKEAVSKRNMLLQQLQAIEDAIARKKQPV